MTPRATAQARDELGGEHVENVVQLEMKMFMK